MNRNKHTKSKQKSKGQQKAQTPSATGEFMVCKPIARVRSSDDHKDGSRLTEVENEEHSPTDDDKKGIKSVGKSVNSNDGAEEEKILAQFVHKAKELKSDIIESLDKQMKRQTEKPKVEETPEDLIRLRECVSELSQIEEAVQDDGKDQTADPNLGPNSETNETGEATSQEEPCRSELATVELVEAPMVSFCQSQMESVADKSEFEPLSSNLDRDSKVVALKASLQRNLSTPQGLERICGKIVDLSETNRTLLAQIGAHQNERAKLLLVKDKLEKLCRELQKANNTIRIESLDLIKKEQSRAKEQANKIQATLTSVMKMFEENQNRNLGLREENVELQTKLRAILEHCDNWEKCAEAALKKKELENRLVKTEMAKLNLVRNEEKEQFLTEKKELLKMVAMMQEHQHKIEGQEARLRSDLSNYASKYDECQTAISSGLSKFQTESKRMLKQMEKSRQDYVALLTKYEQSNKKIAQLLEEKHRFERANKIANKKVETLERLCRALKSGATDCAPMIENGH